MDSMVNNLGTRLRRCSLTTAGLLVWLLLAGVVRCSAQPSPDTTGFSGQVVDESGHGVAGAVVTLKRSRGSSPAAYWGGIAYTDAAGSFRYDDAVAGDYSLMVTASGYSPWGQTQPIGGEQGPLKITLHPLGTLMLSITGKEGVLLRNQQVQVRLTVNSGPAAFSSITTTADGIASVPNIIPATYTVALRSPGHGCLELEDVAVGSGINANRALTLEKGGTLHLSAHERNPRSGKEAPLGGVSAEILPATDTGKTRGRARRRDVGITGEKTSDGAGVVDIDDLLPGNYKVRGVIFGMSRQRSQPLDVDIEAGAVTNADIVFGPLSATELDVAVTGRGDGKAVVDTDFIVLVTSGAQGTTLERRARTDKDGHFKLYPLPPGDCTLMLRAADAGPKAKMVESAKVTTAFGRTPTLAVTW